ncbi:hypothetical protein HK103_001675 [Boothiomyces macroporosus]|uniref:Uncharacterized protein n=1 Tax=Boothiomyces macroporosus TaxID=261099 RepID=A0AAD5UB00_9FUNG|nr:hypothetical protein HK103_001675 [Boothiomyces macroporosus]
MRSTIFLLSAVSINAKKTVTATDMAPSITGSPNGTYNPTATGAKTPKTKSPKTKQTGMTPQQTYMPSQMPTKTPKVVSGGMRNEYLLSLSLLAVIIC